MATVIDSTFGGRTSNSYLSIADADVYFETVPNFAAIWSGLTEDQKTARLIQATRALDRLPLRGSKDYMTQSLEFPRSPNSVRAVGTEIFRGMTEDSPEFAKVKQAQAEMIVVQHFRFGSTGEAIRQQSEVDVPGSVAVKYAEPDKAPDFNASQSGNMDTVRALLRPWLGGGMTFQFVK